MSIDTAALSADLGYMVDDLPATLQIAGISLAVAANDLQDLRDMQLGGFESVHVLQVTAVRSAFTALPTAGLTAYCNSTMMRVEKVLEVSDRVSLVLDLVKL